MDAIADVIWDLLEAVDRMFSSYWAFSLFPMSICRITSASQQQLCLQCVDDVDRHQRWSADRNQRCDIVWMSMRSRISMSAGSDPISFDTCSSGPVLSGNGSVMTNDHWRRGRWKAGSRTVVSSTSEEVVLGVRNRRQSMKPQVEVKSMNRRLAADCAPCRRRRR